MENSLSLWVKKNPKTLVTHCGRTMPAAYWQFRFHPRFYFVGEKSLDEILTESITPVDPVPLEVLPKLSVLRKKYNLTQVDVAKRMNLTPGRISQIENNKKMVKTFSRYLKALGYTMCVMPERQEMINLIYEEKLKPCPFCGTKPKRTVKGQILSVECPSCVSVGFHNHVRLGCLADSQWNERVEPASQKTK